MTIIDNEINKKWENNYHFRNLHKISDRMIYNKPTFEDKI